jgi:hypothetical protein
MGAGSWAGPIGALAGLAAGFLGIGNSKPHRSRMWIDFSPDTDNVLERQNKGGEFEDITYGSAKYTRNYNRADAEAMRGVISGTGKQVEMLLDVIGISETERDYLVRPFRGELILYERDETPTQTRWGPSNTELFRTGKRGSRTSTPTEDSWNEGMSALSFHIMRQSALDAGGWAANVARNYKGSDAAELYKRLHAASPNIQAA